MKSYIPNPLDRKPIKSKVIELISSHSYHGINLEFGRFRIQIGTRNNSKRVMGFRQGLLGTSEEILGIGWAMVIITMTLREREDHLRER